MNSLLGSAKPRMGRLPAQDAEKRNTPTRTEQSSEKASDLPATCNTESRGSSIAPTLVVEKLDYTTKLSSVTSRFSIAQISSIRWRGVVALLAGICQQTLCWGMIMTFGTILSFYTKYLMPQTSKMKLCIIGGLPPFFVLAMSLLWGRLLDAGHHRQVNIAATICLTAGLVGLAFTGGDGDYGDGKYWQILLASIPIGIGQSAYFIAAPHMAKTWYPDRKGLVMGITNSGAAIGMSREWLYNLVLTRIGGSAWPLIFTRLTARYSFRVGIGSLAGISGLFGIFIVFASITAPEFQRRPVAKKSSFATWIPLRALRSRTFLVHTVAMCFVYLGILTVPFFIEYWAQVKKLGLAEDIKGGLGVTKKDGPLTVYLVVIMNACQLPGRLFGSTLCDYFQARKIHFTSCLMAVLIILVFWLTAASYAVACVFAALFGLVLGVMVSLPINDAQDVLGTHRSQLLGQYAGTVYTIASPFILGGVVIGGALVDRFHIRAAGLWAACTIAASAIFILLSLVLKDDTWKFDDPNDRPLDEVILADGSRLEVTQENRDSVYATLHYQSAMPDRVC